MAGFSPDQEFRFNCTNYFPIVYIKLFPISAAPVTLWSSVRVVTFPVVTQYKKKWNQKLTTRTFHADIFKHNGRNIVDNICFQSDRFSGPVSMNSCTFETKLQLRFKVEPWFPFRIYVKLCSVCETNTKRKQDISTNEWTSVELRKGLARTWFKLNFACLN